MNACAVLLGARGWLLSWLLVVSSLPTRAAEGPGWQRDPVLSTAAGAADSNRCRGLPLGGHRRGRLPLRRPRNRAPEKPGAPGAAPARGVGFNPGPRPGGAAYGWGPSRACCASTRLPATCGPCPCPCAPTSAPRSKPCFTTRAPTACGWATEPGPLPCWPPPAPQRPLFPVSRVADTDFYFTAETRGLGAWLANDRAGLYHLAPDGRVRRQVQAPAQLLPVPGTWPQRFFSRQGVYVLDSAYRLRAICRWPRLLPELTNRPLRHRQHPRRRGSGAVAARGGRERGPPPPVGDADYLVGRPHR